MNLTRSSNPALADKMFGDQLGSFSGSDAMSFSGTINKTIFMTLLIFLSGAFSWSLYTSGSPFATIAMFGGGIGGFIVAMIIIFRHQSAPILAPIYAALKGLMLGGISAMYSAAFEGIVLQAILLTIGVMFSMLAIYRSGIIKVNNKFRTGVVAATGGIFVLYLITFVMGLFGVSMPYLHDNSMIGIGINLFIVGIAALNLMLDFDTIERGVRQGAPKFMEWYGAFGLMVTLVWLYLELLRLLARLASRD